MKQNLEMARDYLQRALKKKMDAKAELDKFSFDDCVRDSQECIELSVKAIFYAFGMEPRKTHELDEKDFKELLDSIPADLEPKIGARDFVEPYIYLKFWAPAYLITKYGLEKLGVGGRIFGQDEAQLSIRHADACWSRANIAVNVYGPKIAIKP